VHLIRGNHEAADINALFGFRIECIERMVNGYKPFLLLFVMPSQDSGANSEAEVTCQSMSGLIKSHN
jgi:hypothetical protein